MQKNWLDWVAIVLVIIGAVNIGLVGVASYDVLGKVLGSISWLAMLVNILIGLAGLYLIYFVTKA